MTHILTNERRLTDVTDDRDMLEYDTRMANPSPRNFGSRLRQSTNSSYIYIYNRL